MNDTPETDAKASPHIGFFSCATVPADFARQLERERDEARDMVEKFTEQGLDLMDANRMLKRERDEAREKIKRQAERIRKLEGATNHAGGLYK